VPGIMRDALQNFVFRHIRLRPNDLAFSCERTAMNSDHTMILGPFVCCNGMLGGAALRLPSDDSPERLVHCDRCRKYRSDIRR
jgi:hypothetical protein